MGMVVTLGSLMTDLVGYAARLPAPGESLPGRDFQTFLGGKGCNQAVAARRSRAEVALIGRVGADAYGEAFFPALATEGIDATHVSVSPDVGSGVALILIGADTGQNMILALPRANLTLTPEQTIAALDALHVDTPTTATPNDTTTPTLPNSPAIFLAQLETNVAAVIAGLRHARALGMTTILNTAPIPPEPLDPGVFALVDILVANEVEAGALTGLAVNEHNTATLAAQRLVALGAGAAIVTLGALGGVWAARHPSLLYARAVTTNPRVKSLIGGGILPRFDVHAVDATAAGDAFCGALAAALANGLSGGIARARASAAGAFAVTRRGALPSLPTLAEIDALLGVSGLPDGTGGRMDTTTA